MTPTVRHAVHNVLTDVDSDRYDLATALDRARQNLKDPRDRSLLGEITLGVYRSRSALDHIISQLSSRALSNIDNTVVRILRAALYQLVHLDRIPPHAIVADAVSLTRLVRVSSASGFVNAVLRNYTEQRRAITLPLAPSYDSDTNLDREAAVKYLSVTLSHPRWVIERWLDRHGWPSTAAWARFNNLRAPVAIRPLLNRVSESTLTTQLRQSGVHTVPTRLAQHGLIVTEGTLTPSTGDPAPNYIVQEEAAQVISELVCNLTDQLNNPLVLDLCASPGSKTIGIACNGKPVRVVASDYRQQRTALLNKTLGRHNLPNVSVVRLNAEEPLPFREVFDVILVDAPCTGLGILRRDPDIRWRRVAEELQMFSTRQLQMLKRAATVLAPQGWIVYATCSTEPEETNSVISQFLAEQSGFLATRPPVPALLASTDNDGFFRTLPFRDGVDGFFAATLQKQIL
tara:strand:+ start:4259 stop:5632 length:1374 start_codon:yes stop_codon:yes gene_type:complete